MSLANKFGIPESLLEASKKMLEEANEYQKKVQAHMAKKGIKSLSDMTADQKKKFFNELDAMHKAKNEEVEPIEEAETAPNKDKNKLRVEVKAKPDSTKYHGHYEGKKYEVNVNKHHDQVDVHSHLSPEEVKKQNPHLGKKSANILSAHLKHYHRTQSKLDISSKHRGGQLYRDIHGGPNAHRLHYGHPYVKEEVEPIEEEIKSESGVKVKAGKPGFGVGRTVITHHEHDGQRYRVSSEEDSSGGVHHGVHHVIDKVNHEGKRITNVETRRSGSHYSAYRASSSGKNAGRKTVDHNHIGKIANSLIKAHDKTRLAAGQSGKFQHEEYEPIEEELKGEMHPDAHKVLKHIKPEHHGTYKPYLKKGTYKGDYKDRAAVLSAAEKAGHVKEEVESVELTQEDLDFIASLNKIEEGSGPKEKQKTPYRNINSPASRAAADKRREEMDKEEKSEKGKKLLGKIAAKNEEVDLDEEQLDEIGDTPRGRETLKNYVRKSDADVERLEPQRSSGFGKKTAVDKKIENRISGGISATNRLIGAGINKRRSSTVVGGSQVKEEADLDEEQLDELSKDTVASYAGKAGRTLGGNIQALSKAKEIGQMSYPQKSADQVKTTLKKSIANRKAGLDRAEKRLSENEEFDLDDFTVEEIEEYMQTEEFAQLDELTTDTLHSYLKKREGQTGYVGAKKGVHQSNMMNLARKKIQQAPGSTDQSTYVGSQHAKYAPGHEPARVAATVKKEDFTLEDFTVEEIQEYMQTEEFAQLDELSKATLGSYIKKRSNDVAVQGALTRKYAMDSEAKKKATGGYVTKDVRDLDDKANRAFMKGWKHRRNINIAVDKLINKA